MDILDKAFNALRLDSWHTPATDYPECQVGDYRIHHSRYTPGFYEMHGIDDHILFHAVKSIPITNLQQKRGRRWYNWMVDDPPHWRAMQIYAEGSKGKVLTSGLGLGLIVYGLVENSDVTEIVVVERSAAVVQLIAPHLPKSSKLRFVIGDFYHFVDTDSTQWDTIIADLWVSSNSEQKLELFYYEVIPTLAMLRSRYPEASLTFHGFYSLSDIKFASREIVDKILESNKLMREISNV